MGYNVVLRRNGAKVGHFGPFTTKKQAIAQGQVLADDAARDVVVSVEPQRKKATTKKKKRTNTRRKNPTVPDVWGLPPKYGSKVVPPGDYKTLPLPARMGTHSTLYYEARSPQGGVANLMVEKKGRDRYFLSTDNQVRHEKGKEAREMIKHFLKNGRLPARSNPSRGTFKSKVYAYYTVAGGKLTSGHGSPTGTPNAKKKARAEAIKQANGNKNNVKTTKQAQEYLGKRADGSYRSLTSSASWYNEPRRNPRKRKNSKEWITREGKLGGPGYTEKADRTRHMLLNRSVKGYGYRSTLGSLQVLLRNSHMSSKDRKVIEADKKWLMAKYGGKGSFSKKRRKNSYHVSPNEDPHDFDKPIVKPLRYMS